MRIGEAQRTPDIQLPHFNAVEVLQVRMRKLVERELVTFEVQADGEPEGRCRLQLKTVQRLNPQVDIAIGFRPMSCATMQPVSDIGLRVEAGQGGAHNPSCRRTASGQFPERNPWCRKRASAMRSRPKPTHAL